MRGLLRLLPLEIDHDPACWVVSDRWTLVYGAGPTLPHALWDYLVCVRDASQLRRSDRRSRS
jgi:hypothetical protein